MQQEVYHDESGGKIQPFIPEEIAQMVQKPEVKRVEIFKRDSLAHSEATNRIKKRAKKKGIIK